ncbi:MAG: hypothetical protein LW875_08885 [Proteobacteria bacterium]|nr:hypothetical protein [Pseudomonadota bacterium]
MKIFGFIFALLLPFTSSGDAAGDAAEIAELEAAITALTATAAETQAANAPAQASPSPSVQSCSKAVLAAHSLGPACQTALKAAGYACIGTMSSPIRTAAALVGGLATFASTMSPKDVCKKQKDTLSQVGTLMAAYNTACSAGMMYCNSACGKFAAAQAKATEACTAATTACPGEAAGSLGMVASECPKIKVVLGAVAKAQAATGEASKECAEYKFNLMAAGAGLISIIAEKGKAAGCEKDTQVVCAPGDNSPFCQGINGNTQANVDCSKEENANNTKCICQKAPNTPGCPGAAMGGDSGGLRNASRNSGPSSGAAPGTGKKDNVSFDSFQPTISPTGGSGGGGSSAGVGNGGGGSAGGSVGGSGGGSGADNAKKKAFNTDIMGGLDGGGGGGNGGGGGFGGSGNDPSSSAYKAFMPGGAKDPTRSVAAQGAGSKEVTLGGGKSNFEKVRERYSENYSGLLGE